MSMYGQHSGRPTLECSEDEDRTRQSEKDACDINGIVAGFAKGQFTAHVNRSQGAFLDVSEIGDFREAKERYEKASRFFFGLPARVRREFQNEPANFLDFMTDPDPDVLAELGLAKLKEAPEGAGGSSASSAGGEATPAASPSGDDSGASE